MKLVNKLAYATPVDVKGELTTYWGQYNNGRIALTIVDEAPEEGPIATATVNLPDANIPKNAIAVKNYSENEGMVDTLVASGVIKPEPLKFIMSGFVSIGVYELTKEALADLKQ